MEDAQTSGRRWLQMASSFSLLPTAPPLAMLLSLPSCSLCLSLSLYFSVFLAVGLLTGVALRLGSAARLTPLLSLSGGPNKTQCVWGVCY